MWKKVKNRKYQIKNVRKVKKVTIYNMFDKVVYFDINTYLIIQKNLY